MVAIAATRKDGHATAAISWARWLHVLSPGSSPDSSLLGICPTLASQGQAVHVGCQYTDTILAKNLTLGWHAIVKSSRDGLCYALS